MYALYKRIHEPTVVEHCVQARFTDPNEPNLIVGKTSVLEVYRLAKFPRGHTGKKKKEEEEEESGVDSKLELIGQYGVFGNIEGIGVVRLGKNKRDSLILTFRDAKFSIVDFHLPTMDIKTTSLHFYEDDEISGGILDTKNFQPIVRVDPENRCAVVLVYGHQLVVVPFREELGEDVPLVEEEEGRGQGRGGGTGPASSSYSYVLPTYVRDLEKVRKGIRNVKDVTFLHGYNEPTLLILHEPAPTWTGRLSMRKDTCALSAISLNLVEKREPIIWHIDNLPYDSLRIEPVPKPLRGVLLFAQNSILYLNQSNPVFGISLNEFGDNSKYNLKPHKGALCSLDCSQMAYLSKTALLVSLKLGELYVLYLVSDGIGLKDIKLERVGSSAIASCITKLQDGFIFLGSRVSDSHLISYTETLVTAEEGTKKDLVEKVEEITTDKHEAHTKKKRRVDSEDVDDDDLLYDNEGEQKKNQKITYSFNIEDSLSNIGPIRDVQIGEPAFMTEQQNLQEKYDIEMLTCSGYSKNGVLCSVQKGIRPDVISSHDLPTCFGLWTMKVKPSPVVDDDGNVVDDDGAALEKDKHNYLFMSHEKGTTVLSTKEELVEVKNSGFYTDGPTIGVGNVADNLYIVQVYAEGVRILREEKQLQHISVDPNTPIRACSFADPYVMLVLDNNTFSILEENNGSLNPVKTGSIKNGHVLCGCLYKDESNLFVTPTTSRVDKHKKMTAQDTKGSAVATVPEESDDDDLYGDSPSPPEASAVKGSEEDSGEVEELDNPPVVPTYWIVLCRENGNLEIFSLPEFVQSFVVTHVSLSPSILVDTFSSANVKAGPEDPFVKEIIISNTHPRKKTPFLLALLDTGDLLVYQPFAFVLNDEVQQQHNVQQRLCVRFKRIEIDYIFRDPISYDTGVTDQNARDWKAPLGSGKDQAEEVNEEKINDNDLTINRKKTILKTHRQSLFSFHNVGGMGGVFVAGRRPLWLTITKRNKLHVHPMHKDGQVVGFAEFHNINCDRGFIYYNQFGKMRICQMCTHVGYDNTLPFRKIPLKQTPHGAAYHVDSKTYVVATSKPVYFTEKSRQSNDEKLRDAVPNPQGDRFVYPLTDNFEIHLITPVTWESIDSFLEFKGQEHITCIQQVVVHSQETSTGVKGLIAIGTTRVFGEGVSCKGRILIFDIIEVVPEPGRPQTNHKLKLLYEKDQKAAVTAIGSINGKIAAAVGQKVFIFEFRNNEVLEGIAFIDTMVYIHSMKIVRDFIIVGDICKSISVYRFEELPHFNLSLVSRDFEPMNTMSVDFVVDGSTLAFCFTDTDKNFHTFAFQPDHIHSSKGDRLIKQNDFHIGAGVCMINRFRCVPMVTKPGAIPQPSWRHFNFFGTLDGSFGYVIPLPEVVFRRLQMLQNKMVTYLQHRCALNPKAFRLARIEKKSFGALCKNIADGDLLWKFVHLGVVEQRDLARQIGTSPEQIIDDLLLLELATDVF